ncbi:MAG: beta-hydroxyacyl-ACP dehydratase [Planctomycetota bacterium]|nr:MAG: beta-hydroxyacyl-ACP dehydratase [Planctomycetota bacterium]
MRFSLIDRITELEPGRSITAVKNLTMAEEYLLDHFPGFPVMPGVLMLESLVQAGAWLMRASTDFAYSSILLQQARALKFNNFLRPGQTMTVTATIHKWDGDVCTLKAAGHVGQTNTVSARLTLWQFNLRDRNPALAESDERRIRYFRDLFEQIAPRPAGDG